MSGQEFQGKAVLVTGAASGLGLATALAFAAEGASLALVDVNADGLAEAASRAGALGGPVVAIPADIGDAEACAAIVPRALAAFGRLDALCNIAGISRFQPAGQIDADSWDRMFAINVRAPFLLIRAALPSLIENAGAVVNIASASAFLGHAYLAHYAASKAALVSLTKSLAMEFINTPVRINALAPGGINTPMAQTMGFPDGMDFQLISRYVPLRGSADPEDLTDLILLLAGPRGKAFHGACLNADRGITAG